MSGKNGNHPSRLLRLTGGLTPPNPAHAKQLIQQAQAAGVPILKGPGAAKAGSGPIGMRIGFNPDKAKGATNPTVFIEISRPTQLLQMPLAQAFIFAQQFVDAVLQCEEIVAQTKVCPRCGKTLIYHSRDLLPDWSMKLGCPDLSKEEPPGEDPPFTPGVEGEPRVG